MKHLYIAFHKCRNFLMEKPVLFFLFFLGSAICSLMFIYFWGNLLHVIQTYRAVSYTATLRQETVADVKALYDLADEYSTRLDAICLLDGRVLGGRTAEDIVLSHESREFGLLCSNQPEKFYFWGCEADDLLQENACILSTKLLPDVKNNPELTVFGEPLHIIGRTASIYCFISPETFAKLGLPATKLRLTLASSLSKGERSDFLRKFDTLTNESYALQETTADLPLKELLTVILPMLLVYLLSMFAMLYILMYLLEGMTFELSVYGMLGAKNHSLVLIPALVQSALLFGAELFAVLLHRLLYQALFTRINLNAFAYSTEMYVQAVGLMLTLSFAVMLLYLKYRIGGSSVVNLRKNTT